MRALICWKRIREHQREPLLRARLLGVHDTWQREGGFTLEEFSR